MRLDINFVMMTDKLFKKYNLIVGWAVFAIVLLTYSLTVEPTVSFWDCGEYIATSAKLEVGHPPGAPFFQMMGAFIAAFAPNTDKIALLVNYMSVLSSAFTVFFLYFIIVNLAKKIALRSADTLSVAHTALSMKCPQKNSKKLGADTSLSLPTSSLMPFSRVQTSV